MIRAKHCLLLLAVLPSCSGDSGNAQVSWLFREDFEGASQGWASWWASAGWVECLGCTDDGENPDRIFLTNGEAHSGTWSLHMPAAATADYQGADLIWKSCRGERREGCLLEGYDQLYFRTWVKLAPDHERVHHFLAIEGTRADRYWDADGNAGCRPNGFRAAGTTLDFEGDHELFFYTYTPDMHCDSGGYCSGTYAQSICDDCATRDMACTAVQECCWGNHYGERPWPVLPRDEWVCLEMMMELNTPGQHDGRMAYWMNDVLQHEETGMYWRDIPELQLNKVRLQHYLAPGDATQSNRVWFDDVVVSTERIGCEPPSL
jgi:hypothetical protein